MINKIRNGFLLVFYFLAAGGASAADSGVIGLIHATELRSNKLPDAAVIQNLPADAKVRLFTAEGSWAWVGLVEPGKKLETTGWVRAGALDWKAQSFATVNTDGGRVAFGDVAGVAGTRILPPRVNRHALIIGISRYAEANIPVLPGVKFDRQSAVQMAQSMQVPPENIRFLQDEQATGDGIRQALHELNERVQEGDRVFIHYSGHGTRFPDPSSGGCVEALLAYDGGQKGLISNHEMASLLSGITNKTDKLFVMYDACHSGGIAQAQSTIRARGVDMSGDESALRGKFVSTSEECAKPVNVKTRNLIVETTAKGVLPQDIIHLSASRDNEISLDDEEKGGLATQYVRDCMLRDAKDLHNSGSISIDDIRQCAQAKINERLAKSSLFKPHNLVLNGNAEFVPAWFSQEALVPVIAATPPVISSIAPATSLVAVANLQAAPTVNPTPTTVTPSGAESKPLAPLTGEQALRLMYAQRDAKRTVLASLSKSSLKIGRDSLDLSVQSEKAGYVYLALAGSDNKSVYLLFPNDLDQNNRIDAGQRLQLPRANWRVKADGPEGKDNLLVVIADAPRNLSALETSKAGPFMVSLNDANGRAQLGALFTNAKGGPTCEAAGTREKSICSDAYGAALLTVEEKP